MKTAARGDVVFFGMDAPFSRAVLAEVDDLLPGAIRAVVMRGIGSRLMRVRVGGSDSLTNEAQRRALCVLTDDGSRDLIDDLAAMRPQYILVACYPARIPRAIRALARKACLNLHPSLLPRYRGAAPVFWQLRAGEAETGVTLHRVTSRLDAGEIASRRRVVLPDGATSVEIDRLLGRAGAALFVSCAGRLDDISWIRQDERAATSQPLPGACDYRLEGDWRVRRAWNFLRGAGNGDTVFEVDYGPSRVRIRGARSLITGRAKRPMRHRGPVIELPFAGGAVRAVAV